MKSGTIVVVVVDGMAIFSQKEQTANSVVCLIVAFLCLLHEYKGNKQGSIRVQINTVHRIQNPLGFCGSRVMSQLFYVW